MKKHPGFCILLGLHPHYGQSPFPRSVLRIASPSAPGIAVEFPRPSQGVRRVHRLCSGGVVDQPRDGRVELLAELDGLNLIHHLSLRPLGWNSAWTWHWTKMRTGVGLLQEVWQHCACVCLVLMA